MRWHFLHKMVAWTMGARCLVRGSLAHCPMVRLFRCGNLFPLCSPLRLGFWLRCPPFLSSALVADALVAPNEMSSPCRRIPSADFCRLGFCRTQQPQTGGQLAMHVDAMRLLEPECYQPELNKRFATNRARLLALLPGARVEHVGSSAVQGAVSKGDLDICLLVSSSQLEAAVATLKAEGYGEQTDTLRTAELCMLVDSSPDNEHAVQVVAAGSSFECFVWFRDMLNAHPELVRRYNAVKTKAAHLSEEEYREAKSRFIEAAISEHENGTQPSSQCQLEP